MPLLETMNMGIELLLPPAYFPIEEGKFTKWTAEENKQFENALALYDKDTPDRWLKIAATIPGKTVGDVMKQYRKLEEDVSDIEAGLIPLHDYGNNSFTLGWVNHQEGFKEFYSPGGKKGVSTRSFEQDRKKGVPWTEEEHGQFLLGLRKYGKGDWRNISRNFVITRTPTQVASHAQKYFIRQLTGGKDKRRSSIHDITTVNIPDSKFPSPTNNPIPSNHSTATVQPPEHSRMVEIGRELFDCTPENAGETIVYNSVKGNTFMSPFCGISSYQPKLLEQNMHRGNLYGSYTAMYQMQHH